MTLYIHIPFCASKCGYCAFNSLTTSHKDLQHAYIQSLLYDITTTLQSYKNGTLIYQLNQYNHRNMATIELDSSSMESRVLESQPTPLLTSIYIGGGTPSLLPSSVYEMICERIDRFFPIASIAEITIEANPNHLNKQWCEAVARLGVGRISMGVQSFDTKKLAFLERDHNQADIQNAIEYAQVFPHRSIDLIYGTPCDNKSVLLFDLHTACKLPINHLSAYSLMIEKGARFDSLYNKHKHTTHKDTQPKEMVLKQELCDTTEQARIVREITSAYGFSCYEVSNFAKSHKCAHNLSYWAGEEYLACGLSAVGRVGQVRYSGLANIAEYITNPLHKRIECLSVENMAFESLFLGLRSEVGASLATIYPYINTQRLEIALQERVCISRDNRLFANDMLLADEIALWLSR